MHSIWDMKVLVLSLPTLHTCLLNHIFYELMKGVVWTCNSSCFYFTPDPCSDVSVLSLIDTLLSTLKHLYHWQLILILSNFPNLCVCALHLVCFRCPYINIVLQNSFIVLFLIALDSNALLSVFNIIYSVSHTY